VRADGPRNPGVRESLVYSGFSAEYTHLSCPVVVTMTSKAEPLWSNCRGATDVREDLTDLHMDLHVDVRLIPLHLDRSYLFLPLRHVIGQLLAQPVFRGGRGVSYGIVSSF
jgi:hypothetical protein